MPPRAKVKKQNKGLVNLFDCVSIDEDFLVPFLNNEPHRVLFCSSMKMRLSQRRKRKDWMLLRP